MRVLFTALTAVAAFYFTLWFIGALLLPGNTPVPIRLVTALLGSAAAGRYVWRRADGSSGALFTAVSFGALVTGAVGFAAGFFGPLIFAPDANQGPLLGIFITGPLGVLAGAVGGAVYWFLRRRAR
jgi:hypothetical protein